MKFTIVFALAAVHVLALPDTRMCVIKTKAGANETDCSGRSDWFPKGHVVNVTDADGATWQCTDDTNMTKTINGRVQSVDACNSGKEYKCLPCCNAVDLYDGDTYSVVAEACGDDSTSCIRTYMAASKALDASGDKPAGDAMFASNYTCTDFPAFKTIIEEFVACSGTEQIPADEYPYRMQALVQDIIDKCGPYDGGDGGGDEQSTGTPSSSSSSSSSESGVTLEDITDACLATLRENVTELASAPCNTTLLNALSGIVTEEAFCDCLGDFEQYADSDRPSTCTSADITKFTNHIAACSSEPSHAAPVSTPVVPFVVSAVAVALLAF